MTQKKQELKVKTEKHDQIHLWLYDKQNQLKLAHEFIAAPQIYTTDEKNINNTFISIYEKLSGERICSKYNPEIWFDHYYRKHYESTYKTFTIPDEDRVSFAKYMKSNFDTEWKQAFDDITSSWLKDRRNEITADTDVSWFVKNIGYDSRQILESWIEAFQKIISNEEKVRSYIDWYDQEYLQHSLKVINIDINKVIAQKVERNLEVQDVEYTISEIKREVPMYSGYYKNLANVIDCLISVDVKVTGKVNLDEYSKDGSWTWDNYHSFTKKFTLLCEFKPILYSISSLLGQIHIYINHLNSIRQYSETKIKPIIITFDENRQYDMLLDSEGIGIYRLTNGVQNDIEK
jgi:hypothetical protein